VTDDNVIVGEFDQPTIRERIPKRDECLHQAVEVDPRNRVVVCCNCDALVDPIVVLVEIAKRERRCWYQSKQAKDARNQLREEIDQLKKEKRNLDRQVQRRRKRSNAQRVP